MLQTNGLILHDDDIGYVEAQGTTKNNLLNYWFSDTKNAEIFDTTAKLMSDHNPGELNKFDSYSNCVNKVSLGKALKSRPKYRSFDGYGNNLKNPYWGTPGTPLGRLTPKHFDDGVRSIRKSVTGSELPNPRKIVRDILMKAEKQPFSPHIPSLGFVLLVLYLGHDMAHTVPFEAFDSSQTIRCCSHAGKHVLSRDLSHSACLPISISKNDYFYHPAGIRCLNFIRSQPGSLPNKVQYGEVLNKATGYLDHSIIYGINDAENRRVRSFSKGKFNMDANNLFPVDANGRSTKDVERLLNFPSTAFWPVIFARNHNNLAEGLARINPAWSDEKLFQEARRINIAVLEHLIVLDPFVESIFKKKINESYDENVDASQSLEFTDAAYRFDHYFVQPDVWLTDKNGQTRRYQLMDTSNRIDFLRENFDDVVRGSLIQPVNSGQYADALHNRFLANKAGFGLDVFAMDILRGRDHGIGTWLETRRKCGFKADFKSFSDLETILPKSYADLLRDTYESVEDIDLIVGGALETFRSVKEVFTGETFGCIIGNQFQKTMAGDAYFFTHKTSPYPFTDSQIAAVKAMKFNNLICVNTNLETTTAVWFLLENELVPKVPCSEFKQMDLSAWKNV